MERRFGSCFVPADSVRESRHSRIELEAQRKGNWLTRLLWLDMISLAGLLVTSTMGTPDPQARNSIRPLSV